MTREELGQMVRQIWIDYCLETGDTKPSHTAPWEQLSDWDREVDMRIGEILFNTGRKAGIKASIKQLMDLA
jgi:hypothetical protein